MVLLFTSYGWLSAGGCYWQANEAYNAAFAVFESCRDECYSWSVLSPNRCLISCDAQLEGRLNRASDTLDRCLAQK